MKQHKRTVYEQRKRDRKRLLKIKKMHKEYHKKVDAILKQINGKYTK